jgi:hypothetical protein
MTTYVIEPDSSRNREITDYGVYDKAYNEIIYMKHTPEQACLMFQYEDEKGDPIEESISLKFKNPITKYEDLLQTTFVPDLSYCSDSKRIKIPSNVHSVVVIGLLRKYRTENNAMAGFGIGELDDSGVIGMSRTRLSYGPLVDTRFSCNQFDFKSHERTLSHGNDLIKEIVFKDGFFDHLETTGPIVEIGLV